MSDALVVVRCGRSSRHPEWVAGGGAPRGFDLLLCPYEEIPGDAGSVPPCRPIPGPKWAGLSEFLRRDRAWERYDYVWLPDDDLGADTGTIARFFDRCRESRASLAAPALAEGSKHSHLVTLRNRAFRIRSTTFVEIMAPCFRVDVLTRLLPTFSESRTGEGWGLDDAWARILCYRGIFVVDDAPVRHDRPVGSLRSPAQTEAARADMRHVRRRLDACSIRKTLGGVDASGSAADERDAGFLDAYLGGYRWHLESHPDDERRLRRDQAKDPDAWVRGAEERARRASMRTWWRHAILGRSGAPPAGA